MQPTGASPTSHAPHAAAASPAVVPEPAVTPAAVVGMLLLAVVIGVFVWLAVREDAVRTDLAAAAQARQDAAPISEGERIRRALVNAQAAAERVWRNSTPPEQRRAQDAEMLARFRAEENAMLSLQTLRRLAATAASDAAPR